MMYLKTNIGPFASSFMGIAGIWDTKISLNSVQVKGSSQLSVTSSDVYTIIKTDLKEILAVVNLLKRQSNYKFEFLSDICVIDYPARKRRFSLLYNFLSIRNNFRTQIEIRILDFCPVPSIAALFPSAVWLEREVWDMYGIFFSNHPDLRRILTDYNFEGFPLRKDFPLSGFIELRYDDTEKKVVYEFLETSQEFRFFDFTSPWEELQRGVAK